MAEPLSVPEEIRDEIPTNEALLAYVDVKLAITPLGMLTPGEEKHYHPEVQEAIAFLSSKPIRLEFSATVRRTVFEALKQLNSIPRDDVFWRNTNLRPTFFKLPDFAAKGGNMGDPTISVAMALLSPSFENSRWISIHTAGAVSLEFVFFYAMLTEIGGTPCAEGFASFVKATKTQKELAPMLLDVIQSGGGYFNRWAESVRDLLSVS